jgi:GAF domain-containing protein
VYDHQRYLEALSEFSKILLTSYDVETVLGELSQQSTAIFALAGSGVSLGRGGGVAYATAVPDQVARLERVQQHTQTGPCVQAYRTGRTVAVADLSEAVGLWPEYCAAAERAGISGVAALPLTLADERVGSLDLYADEPRGWDTEDLKAARVMADMATAYLINASELAQQVQLAGQLGAALNSRVVVEQAKGIVASRSGISVDEAFQRIRSHARERRSSIHDVATTIVDQGLVV